MSTGTTPGRGDTGVNDLDLDATGLVVAEPRANGNGDRTDATTTAAYRVANRPRRRRTRIVTRRWRTLIVLLVVLLLAAAIPLLGVIGAHAIFDSREGRTIERAGRAADTVLPSTPAELAIETDESGRAVAMVVVSLAPGGKGGFAILIPAGTLSEIPGAGQGRVGTAYDTGGASLASQAIEGLLGIRLERAVVLDAAAWGELVAQPVTVRFDDPVQVTGADGKPQTLYPAGPASIRPDAIAALLAAHTDSETELAGMVRQQEFWEGLLSSYASTQGAATSTEVPASSGPASATKLPPVELGQLLAGIAAGRFEVTQLPVQPFTGGPDGERYAVVQTPMRVLVAQAMPGAVSPASGNPRIRIVNPTADAGVLAAAADRILFLGDNLVIASDSLDPPEATTKVLFSRPELQSAADSIVRALGVGATAPDPTVVDGLDITVVLGTDFATVAAAQPTTTTTVAVQATTTSTRRTATTTKRSSGTTRAPKLTVTPTVPATDAVPTSGEPVTTSAVVPPGDATTVATVAAPVTISGDVPQPTGSGSSG